MAPVDFEGFQLPRLLGENLSLNFANTVDDRFAEVAPEFLLNYEVFVRWGQYTQVLTEAEAERLIALSQQQPDATNAVYRRAIVLREAIHRIFAAIAEQQPVADADLTIVNGEYAHAMQYVQLQQVDDAFILGWKAGDALDRILWALSRSAVELLTSPMLERVRLCPSEGCGWLFVDTSKNRSRRWCSMEGCGNMEKQRRHQRRVRKAD